MGSITRGIANNILGSGAVDGTDGLSGTVPANNIANASLNNLTSLPPSVQAGIPSVASNPSPVSEGDVWYNNVAFKLRVQGKAISSASWSSGGSMNVASHARSGIGQVNTAVLAVGVDPAPQGRTELYNGSSWTEVGDLNNVPHQQGWQLVVQALQVITILLKLGMGLLGQKLMILILVEVTGQDLEHQQLV